MINYYFTDNETDPLAQGQVKRGRSVQTAPLPGDRASPALTSDACPLHAGLPATGQNFRESPETLVSEKASPLTCVGCRASANAVAEALLHTRSDVCDLLGWTGGGDDSEGEDDEVRAADEARVRHLFSADAAGVF